MSAARNATHQSTTDPDSRLIKKTRGSEAKLAYIGEVLMENGQGLIVDACVIPATGTGEREASLGLLAALPPGCATLGADTFMRRRPRENVLVMAFMPRISAAC